eukprot:Opistho-2@78492
MEFANHVSESGSDSELELNADEHQRVVIAAAQAASLVPSDEEDDSDDNDDDNVGVERTAPSPPKHGRGGRAQKLHFIFTDDDDVLLARQVCADRPYLVERRKGIMKKWDDIAEKVKLASINARKNMLVGRSCRDRMTFLLRNFERSENEDLGESGKGGSEPGELEELLSEVKEMVDDAKTSEQAKNDACSAAKADAKKNLELAKSLRDAAAKRRVEAKTLPEGAHARKRLRDDDGSENFIDSGMDESEGIQKRRRLTGDRLALALEAPREINFAVPAAGSGLLERKMELKQERLAKEEKWRENDREIALRRLELDEKRAESDRAGQETMQKMLALIQMMLEKGTAQKL